MSFRTALTDVELCNRALSLLPEEPIATMEQGGHVGRTCRQWYKPTVAWLLERHHWNLGTRREALAVTANPRANEWRYAYARPADLAYIIGTARSASAVGVGVYPAIRALYQPKRYERVGDVIYSNTEDTFFDFTSYDTTEADFDEQFANVIVLSLASRFAMPITKKASVAENYRQQASDALLLVMARNANENNPTYGDAPSESELIRGAFGGVGFYDPSWPAL